MIKSLWIRNLILVEDAELHLAPGLTALTGETGAGKSLVLSSFGLAGGSRAQGSLVRQGKEKAEISLEIQLDRRRDVSRKLKDFDLTDDGGTDETLLVRRVVLPDRSSRAYVNGSPTSASALQQLLEPLLEIHGQREQYALSQPNSQRDALDDFGGLRERRQKVTMAFESMQRIRTDLEALRSKQATAKERADFLAYQLQEFDALQLDPQELAELQNKSNAIRHAANLTKGYGRVLSLLSDDEASVLTLLHSAERELAGLSKYTDQVSNWSDQLSLAGSSIGEIVKELSRAIDLMQGGDERDVDTIESRIAAIQSMLRKFGTDYDGLFKKMDAYRAEFTTVENIDGDIMQLQSKLEQAERDYDVVALQLTEQRKKAAKKLQKLTSEHLKDLALKVARFEVSVETDPNQRTVNGNDRIEFMFASMPDLPLEPMRKVASGGELSRLMLAVDLATVDSCPPMTLIFDEIDAGVGGETAVAIADKLKELSRKHQVLCVTHLAQLAAAADVQYRIIKVSHGNRSETQIQRLNTNDRIDELGRMLGGASMKATLEVAKEMLARYHTS